MVLQSGKNGLATEVLQAEGYGYCQLVLAVSILPVTLYVIRKNVLDLHEQAREDLDQLEDSKGDEALTKNPLADVAQGLSEVPFAIFLASPVLESKCQVPFISKLNLAVSWLAGQGVLILRTQGGIVEKQLSVPRMKSAAAV